MKSSVNRPSFMLPGMKTHANCIRFCPYLLKLKPQPEDQTALIDLPYRMVFAVATIDNAIIYSTQSTVPIAVIKNLHYDSINDMTWVMNHMLMVASSDGYVSFITMDEQVIGEILPPHSEAMPEVFKEHYTALQQLSFQYKVEEANLNKQTSFQKISFKSRKQALTSNNDQIYSKNGPVTLKADDQKDSWCGPDRHTSNIPKNSDTEMRE